MKRIILSDCFPGKSDNIFEQIKLFAIISSVIVYVAFLFIFSEIRGMGMQFVYILGISAFVMSKGYWATSIKDCGEYSFTAADYHNDLVTMRTRGRTVKYNHYFVTYQTVLGDGSMVVYDCPVPDIETAIKLTSGRNTLTRQVFQYENLYCTAEPGTDSAAYLDSQLKWRTVLLITAGIYGVLGIFLILFDGCSPAQCGLIGIIPVCRLLKTPSLYRAGCFYMNKMNITNI